MNIVTHTISAAVEPLRAWIAAQNQSEPEPESQPEPESVEQNP